MENKELRDILINLEGRDESLYDRIHMGDYQRSYDKGQIDILKRILGNTN